MFWIFVVVLSTLFQTVLGGSIKPPNALGGEYLGCFEDANIDVGKSLQQIEHQGPALCVKFCTTYDVGPDTPFLYAAIAKGTWCKCTNTLPTTPSTGCNIPCPFYHNLRDNYTCGGAGAFNVYRVLPISNYMGCFQDNVHNRIFDMQIPINETTSTLTPDLCISKCSGYKYAGLTFGDQCWCGKYLNKRRGMLPDYYCGLPCVGDSSYHCGANEEPPMMDVYRAHAASLTPSLTAFMLCVICVLNQ